MSEPTAAIEIVTGYDPLLLLERAAGGFLKRRPSTADDPFPTPSYLLALRQGGLRDDLIALAAGRGVPGWFDPPLCIFHELPAWLGQTTRRACNDFERAVILGGVLRGIGGDVFGRKLQRPEDFLAAIDRLVGELVAEGVSAGDLTRALESRAGRDEFERSRDHELAVIYGEYLAALERGGRRDGRDTWLDCARAVAEDAEELARRLGGRRELRLFGLNDLRDGWRPLLRALSASPALDRIVIYTAEPLDLGAELDVSVSAMDAASGIVARLFADEAVSGGAGGPAVRIVAAPDIEREMDEVARRVRVLADGGVPLRDIAVVAHQARPYVDLVLGALARFGVPATARRRVALREIPVVRAVRALFAAAADGWGRHTLVELAEQPYFASELDALVLNFAGFRRRICGLDAWAGALAALETEARAHEEERAGGVETDDRRGALPPSVRIGEVVAGLAAFATGARALDSTRTLRDWVGWLEAFLADDPWAIHDRMHAVPGGRFDVARLDLAGWKALAEIARAWREALDAWGGAEDRIGVDAFHAQLTDLLEGDAALWTPTLAGVQVLEGFAAAYRSFAHVFIVGLEAGRFPLRAPGSPLLDEWERQELADAGLPFEGRKIWDRREQDLFRLLIAGARSEVTVSYARLDVSGREVVRSAFVDALAEAAAVEEEEIATSRVLTEGARRYVGAAAPARARHAVAVEAERAAGVLSPYNGLIEDAGLRAWLAEAFGDGRRWSPTQLESFAKCPWSYFSARLLRIARLDDPDEEMDHATRGSVLHDALHRFYDDAARRAEGPVLLRAPDLAWARDAVSAALDAALADARGRIWLGHAALQGAKREELRRMLVRYLEFEVEHNEKLFNNRTNNAFVLRTGVAEHELAFDDLVLERGGVRFRFRGSIDRVEVGIDERVPSARFIAAVDYKTSASSAPGGNSRDKDAPWHDGVVLQVPLYAYALTQLRPGHAVSRVEYRAIRQRRTVHSLELHQVDRKAGTLMTDPDAQARLDGALDAVATHVLRARGGEFPAAPAESCGCPPFCHALEICRVAGGPRTGGR